MECYQIVIRRDNGRLVTIFAHVYYSGNYSYYQAFYSKKCDARLTKQMAEREGVTEQLKATDQMSWVGAMNNIRARAEEMVGAELIYV